MKNPTRFRKTRSCWVGFSFLLILLGPGNSLAQTSVKETGSQLVLQAEAALRKSEPDSIQQAISLYQAAATAFHQNNEIESEALAWHKISQLAAKTGAPAQAQSAASRARLLLRSRTYPSTALNNIATAQAARAYLTLGRIQLESDEPKEAFDSYQNGLFLAGNAKLPREAAAAHVALALLAAQTGELEIAIDLTTKSLDLWRAAKDFGGEAMALNNLARFAERRGDLQQATEFDEQAINIHRFRRNTQAETSALLEARRLHLMMGNYDAAAFACEQLIGLAHKKGDAKNEGEHLLSLAIIEAQRNNSPSAYQLLLKAVIVGNQPEITAQSKELANKFRSQENIAAQKPERENLIKMAESEASRGAYAAAYQLLLRALVMNEGKSDALNLTLNKRIKTIAQQIEAHQKNLPLQRP